MAWRAIFEFVAVLFSYILIIWAHRDYIYVYIGLMPDNAREALQSLIFLVVTLTSCPAFHSVSSITRYFLRIRVV
jgi:hypothetical protein